LGGGVSIIGAFNTIGGTATTPGAPPGNVISGGNGYGIAIGAQVGNNQIRGNIIGATQDGLAALPNFGGIYLATFSGNNVIGGSAVGDRNLISGNSHAGVECGECSNGNIVKGNWIGVNISGTAPLPNGIGVVLAGNSPTRPPRLTVGGPGVGDGNVISG